MEALPPSGENPLAPFLNKIIKSYVPTNTKKMVEFLRFHEGKYKGLTYKEVYQGTKNIDKELIKDFLIERLKLNRENDFKNEIINIYEFKIFRSVIFIYPKILNLNKYESFLTIGMNEFKSLINTKNITIKLDPQTKKFIAISDSGGMYKVQSGIDFTKSYEWLIPNANIAGACIINKDEKNKKYEIEQIFKNPKPYSFKEYLSFEDFNNRMYSNKKSVPFITSGNPEYFKWMYKNYGDFFIDPLHIQALEKLEVYAFKGIELNQITENIYEYEPKIEIRRFEFSKEIIEINEKNYKKSLDWDPREDDFRDKVSWTDRERDYFDAMTDGQLGSYDDFIENGGDIDSIDDWAGR